MRCALWRGFCSQSGGGGIRTRGALAGTPVFKTGAISRSATPPSWRKHSRLPLRHGACKPFEKPAARQSRPSATSVIGG